MPEAHPIEFRRDVVVVARKREVPVSPVAKDFGDLRSCLNNWVEKAHVQDGLRPGVTPSDSAELREAGKRIRLLEQEAEVMRRAVAYFARDASPNWCTRWSLILPRRLPLPGCPSR